jgi:hypothetical protein
MKKVRFTPYRNSSEIVKPGISREATYITKNKGYVVVVVAVKVKSRHTTALFLEHKCTQQQLCNFK